MVDKLSIRLKEMRATAGQSEDEDEEDDERDVVGEMMVVSECCEASEGRRL